MLVRDAPAGDYVVETKVRLRPAGRGLLLQLRPGRAGRLRRRRQLHQADGRLDLGDPADGVREGAGRPCPRAGAATATPSSVRPADDWTYLRIVVERLTGASSRGRRRHRRYTAYTSQDGKTWVRGGVWTHSLGDDAQIGLVSMGATDQVTSPITAEFDYVRVSLAQGRPAGLVAAHR